MADFAGEICQERGRLGRPSRQRRAPRAPWGLPTPDLRSTTGQPTVNLRYLPYPSRTDFSRFCLVFRVNEKILEHACLKLSVFKKGNEISVSVGGLGSSGRRRREKKRENQMFLQSPLSDEKKKVMSGLSKCLGC